MRKLYLFLFALIILTSFISAETETFPQSIEVQFIKSCTNSSGSICSPITLCNVTVKSPVNNSLLVNNKAMNNNENGLFNYTLSSSINSVRGYYDWDMFCCDSTDCGEAHGVYQVTTNGEVVTTEKVGISIAMILLLVSLFVFVLYIYFKLPSKTTYSDDELGLNFNNVKYFKPVLFLLAYTLLLGIIFVSSNLAFLFLDNNLIGDLLFKIFLGMGYLFIPMIVILFLVNLIKAVNDRTLKSQYERGFDMGGNAI